MSKIDEDCLVTGEAIVCPDCSEIVYVWQFECPNCECELEGCYPPEADNYVCESSQHDYYGSCGCEDFPCCGH